MLDYNTIFFAECQDGNGFLFHFINFAQTQVIFYSRLTSRDILFLLYMCSCFQSRSLRRKLCSISQLITFTKNSQELLPYIQKKPPRTPPQWEESSAVFVYQVCCSLRTSFCTAFYPHQRYFRRGGTKTFRLIGFSIKGCYFATAPKSAFS